MDRTELLLQYDPVEAIVMMLNLENGTSLPIDAVDVGPPQPGTTKNTKVTLKIRRPAARNDDLPDPGEITFEYNRLDVAHHFAGVLSGIDIELPTSVQVLLNLITERVGQTFILDDIVLEDIGRHNAGAFLLRAKSESHRWYGQFIVHLGGVTDINDILDPYVPATLGELMGAEPFSVPNVAMPFINATAWQNVVSQWTVGAHPQDGEPIEPVLSQLAIPYDTPHYRVPLHRNTQFELGNDGWSVSTMDTATASISGHACQMTLTNGSVQIARSVTFIKRATVELTVEGTPLEPLIQGQPANCQLAAVVTSANGQWTQTVPLTVANYTGTMARVFQAYVRSPFDGPHVCRIVITGTNAALSIRHIAWRSFPSQWVLEESMAVTQASLIDSDTPTVISMSGTQLLCGSNAGTQAEARARFNVPVYAGRSYQLTFTIDSNTFTDALSFEYLANCSMVDVHLSQYAIANGSQATVVLTMPEGAIGGELLLRVKDTGGQAVLSNLQLQPLPLPFREDQLSNHDFNEGPTGFTLLDGAYGKVSMVGGNVYSQTLTNTAFGVRFQTTPLVPSERYRVRLETVSVTGLIPDASNRYVGVKVSQFDGLLTDWTSGTQQAWNPTNVKRFNNPVTLTLEGRASAWSGENAVVMDVFNYYYPTGALQDGAFGSLLHYVSISVSYSRWVVDASATRYNWYNTSLVHTFVPMGQQWNGLLSGLTQRHELTLDPAYSQEYSQADLRLPFVPEASIESIFQSISQFTRFNVVTCEDASYFREVIAPLMTGTVISLANFPESMPCDPSQTTSWIVSAIPAMKNLHGATVQYNGPLRHQDPMPMATGLDRVMVVFLSPTDCLGYRGQIRFYYSGRYLT